MALNPVGTFNAGSTYTLIHADGGGLNGAAYFIANNVAYTAVITATANDVSVSPASATALSTAYWTGGLSGATGAWALSSGAQSNWAATSGSAVQALVPGSAADVIISNSSVTTTPTATTLGASMTIKSLTIADTTSGLGLNADGNALTITPASSATGITMNAGVPASTIATPLVLGAAQTWTNNSANLLTISGIVTGANLLTVAGLGNITISGVLAMGTTGLTKAGSGVLVVTAANTYSGATIVNGGTLQVGNGISGSLNGMPGTTPSALTFSGSGTVKLQRGRRRQPRHGRTDIQRRRQHRSIHLRRYGHYHPDLRQSGRPYRRRCRQLCTQRHRQYGPPTTRLSLPLRPPLAPSLTEVFSLAATTTPPMTAAASSVRTRMPLIPRASPRLLAPPCRPTSQSLQPEALSAPAATWI